jgi:hypothetical protein
LNKTTAAQMAKIATAAPPRLSCGSGSENMREGAAKFGPWDARWEPRISQGISHRIGSANLWAP